MNEPEESLDSFKRYITRLLSANTADPNAGIDFAGDALGAIMAYSLGTMSWQDFVWKCEAMLEDIPNEE